MNIIDLATKTMQTGIKSVVDTIKLTVDITKTNVDNTATKVDGIDIKVGALLDGRIVKSIQRGYGGQGTNTTIPISVINPAKTIVLLNGVSASGGGSTTLPILENLTASSLKINAFGNNVISWQVIEFY